MALMLSSVLMKPAISTITLAMSLFADGRLSSGAYVTYTALMPHLPDDVTCICDDVTYSGLMMCMTDTDYIPGPGPVSPGSSAVFHSLDVRREHILEKDILENTFWCFV